MSRKKPAPDVIRGGNRFSALARRNLCEGWAPREEVLGARTCPRAGGMRGNERHGSSISTACLLSAPPTAPEARLRVHALLDFPPLLRAQDRGRISHRLREALAGGIDERDLLRAQRLDGGAVDRRRQQKVVGALARCLALLAHGNEVAHRRLDDRAQTLLLLVGGIDLDRQMPHHAVGAILDLRRIHLAHHEAAAMPAAVAERPEAGLAEGLAGKERCRADAKRNQEGDQGAAATPHRRRTTWSRSTWICRVFGHLCLR